MIEKFIIELLYMMTGQAIGPDTYISDLMLEEEDTEEILEAISGHYTLAIPDGFDFRQYRTVKHLTKAIKKETIKHLISE